MGQAGSDGRIGVRGAGWDGRGPPPAVTLPAVTVPTLRRRGLQVAGVAVVAVLSVGLFFRYDLTTGFNLLFGDRYDGMIETTILEHWFNVVRGVSHWSQTLYFFPVAATLGYNDGYLVFGAIYSVFRGLGADPFLASELVDIAVKLLGFVGFHVFAVRVLRLPGRWAALGAAVFTLSNNSYMQGSHVQLFSVAFAPILALIFNAAILAVGQRDRRAVAAWGVLAGLAFPAWLLTSYYMAWFFMLFCLLWAPLLLLSAGRRRVQALVADGAACWLPLAASFAVLAFGLLQFAQLYLPKAAETGMHGVREMASYLLSPLDTFNLGGNNALHGGWHRWLQPALSPNLEHATGFTPFVLLAFLAGGVWAVRRGGRAGVAGCMALAAGALWLAAISVGGVSLWNAVYAWVPGARAIRVVSRIQIFLAWPVVSVAEAGLAALEAALRPRGGIWAALPGVVGLLLVVEQYNAAQVPLLDRAEQLAWLRSVPAPPAECRSFYVSKPRAPYARFGPEIASMVGHDIDAMLLAEWFGRPTVNGFASLLPTGWNLLWIGNPDYLERVRDYATARGVAAGLCSLDLSSNRWAAD